MRCLFSVLKFKDRWCLYLFRTRKAYKAFKPYKTYIMEDKRSYKATRYGYVRLPRKFENAIKAWEALTPRGEDE